MSPISRLAVGWRIVHYAILINFLLNIAYGSYMVFFVLRPPGVTGPLMSAAASVPIELMVTRRMYANEFWISFSGFAVYLAVTELLPRLLAQGVSPKVRASSGEE